MQYPILRESRVVIWDDGRVFEFNALASYSSSTSYEEYKTTRKTLHRHSNYPISKITKQNSSSISLQVNFTSTASELILFEWLGLERVVDTFVLPKYSSNIEPKMLKMSIVMPEGKSVTFSNVYLSALDISLDKEIPIINAGFEAGGFKVGTSPPTPSILQGEVLPFYPVSANINSYTIPGLISCSLSLQQQCEWRENRNLHNIDTIYRNTRAVVKENNCSAILSRYYIEDIGETSDILPTVSPINIKNNIFNLDIPLARITKRLEFSDIFKMEYDIIPIEESEDPVTITFLEK